MVILVVFFFIFIFYSIISNFRDIRGILVIIEVSWVFCLYIYIKPKLLKLPQFFTSAILRKKKKNIIKLF